MWNDAAMAKLPVTGTAARLDDIFRSIHPDGLSERQWCIRANVSTSFFTDIRKGSVPSLDKVERVAGVAGFSLAKLLAMETGEIAVLSDLTERDMPSESVLTQTLAILLSSVGVDPYEDERARKIARQFPNALKEVERLMLQLDQPDHATPLGPKHDLGEDLPEA